MKAAILLLITSFALLGIGGGIGGIIGVLMGISGVACLLLSGAAAVTELRKKKLANKYIDLLVRKSMRMASDINNMHKKDDKDFFAMHIIGLGLVLLKRDLVHSNFKTSDQQDIFNEVKCTILSKVPKTSYQVMPSHMDGIFDSVTKSLFQEFNSFIHSNLRAKRVDDLAIHDLTRSLAKAIRPNDEVSARSAAGRIVREIVELYMQNKPIIKSRSRRYISFLLPLTAISTDMQKKLVFLVVTIAIFTGGYQVYQYNRAPNERDRLVFIYECDKYIANGIGIDKAKAACSCLWPDLVGRYQTIGKINDRVRYDGNVNIGDPEVNAMTLTCLKDYRNRS